MRFIVHYGDDMDSPAERLRHARAKMGFTSAKDAADAMGVPVSTYTQHENGDRGFPAKRAERYARFFRVQPEWLLYGKALASQIVDLGPKLYVVGEVAAGVFKTAWQKDRDEWQAFTGRSDLIVPASQRFGLRVKGDSMNLVYPPDTILECRYYNGDDLIPEGKRVIVQRTAVDGTVEATVKELARDDLGHEWLVPRSTNPTHQAFRGDECGPDIESVQIIAVVVGSYRAE